MPPGFDAQVPTNDLTMLPPGTEFDLSRCGVQEMKCVRPSRVESEKPLVPPLHLDDARVPGADGRGELVYDRFNRIKEISDGAGRKFEFGYDDRTNQINKVQNDTGIWHREMTYGGHHYTDNWINEDRVSRWSGNVHVSEKGYSFSDSAGHLRIQYDIGGAKTIEYMNRGEIYGRRSEMPNGDVMTMSVRDGKTFASETRFHNGDVVREDYRTQRSSMKFRDGRTCETNMVDKSSVFFDQQGRLTAMKDAGGREFQMGKYDDDGKPSSLTDAAGKWVRVNHHEWLNRQTSQRRNDIAVDAKNGSITYSDHPGRTVTHGRDGSTKSEYGGIRTVTMKDGTTKREYVDGKDFLEPPTEGMPQFVVKDGVTTGVKLKLNHGQMFVAGGDDPYANIRVKEGSSVGAFQDGRVAFTSKNAEGNCLTGADYEAIEKLKGIAKDQDFVVVQCFDPKSNGVRYEIYTGLDGVNVERGDVVKRGQPLGRAGHGEFNYAVKRQRPSGPAIKFL